MSKPHEADGKEQSTTDPSHAEPTALTGLEPSELEPSELADVVGGGTMTDIGRS